MKKGKGIVFTIRPKSKTGVLSSADFKALTGGKSFIRKIKASKVKGFYDVSVK